MKSNVVDVLEKAKRASYQMGKLSTEEKNELLERFSKLMEANQSKIIQENLKDQKLNKGKIPDSLFERLKLDSRKLEQLIEGVREVKKLEDPSNQIIFRRELREGLVLEKRTAPLGVLAIIFESRPDAVPQILSLALKSGNVTVLKGGSEASHSVKVFMDIAALLATESKILPKEWTQSFNSREEIQEVLAFPEYVDLVIPRGSGTLVRSVQRSTTIPVLGHAEGICHVYVHKDANLDQAVSIVIESKTQYPAACNSIETLLIEESIAKDFLPKVFIELTQRKVEIRACPKTILYLPKAKAANETDWTTEYGDLILAIKIVKDLSEAIAHINQFGSHHTDCIVTEDEHAREVFLSTVDSAGVFANASTRFADGFRYGLGAEVGVSTSKLHARGPVGLDGLVTTKYLLRGNGHKCQ